MAEAELDNGSTTVLFWLFFTVIFSTQKCPFTFLRVLSIRSCKTRSGCTTSRPVRHGLEKIVLIGENVLEIKIFRRKFAKKVHQFPTTLYWDSDNSLHFYRRLQQAFVFWPCISVGKCDANESFIWGGVPLWLSFSACGENFSSPFSSGKKL